jgi:Fe-S cluster assembly scaffold protein SufB
VLCKEPKWDAYLERLDEPEADKRKYSSDEDVGQQFSLDDVVDERPIGGKKAKEQRRKKKKEQPCIIDLEDEFTMFVDVQRTTNEGRKDMLETQRRVSSENLEAQRLAHLAAKEKKESVMVETYQLLLTQDTTMMPEEVRSEHVLALKCFREKLFGKND